MAKCDWCGRREGKVPVLISGARYKSVCSEKCKHEGLKKWGTATAQDKRGFIPRGYTSSEWAKVERDLAQEERDAFQFFVKCIVAFFVFLFLVLILTRIWFILAMIVVLFVLLLIVADLPDDKKKIQLYVAAVLFVSFTIWGFLPGGLAGF